MLHFPRWKVFAILAVVLAGAVFAAPLILPITFISMTTEPGADAAAKQQDP
jgi:hypothetical protein